MISFITPPVALGAYAASSIAKSNPMTTGFEAMRLGSIIYFVPFFFVLNPALIGRAPMMEVVIVLGTALAGIALICGALQGYMWGIGRLDGNMLAWPGRVLLVVAGIVLALPGGKLVGFTHIQLLEIAAAFAAAGLLLSWLGRARDAPTPA
jgi:TRAP-type uncharacterized transport system fused permease subunit